ncbi:hypothetical protein F0919_14095 [Taibaiella lutea]|uniref:Protein SirB1 N-terminal domain-containing protein n=1 Tax=Taibaiella lutea TaxID=2608001 RepID=A0A5M6CER9_9BACT|nr:hypothetical protein [Taibaiella lutea]KAA5533664.1 hypothetical protein F0919_14095 [Taibaiella lutea]
MRKFLLVIFCLSTTQNINAQIMPSAPQPATFTPVQGIGVNDINQRSPINLPNANNGTSVYDADLRRQAQYQREYENALVDVREAFSKPVIHYSLPSHLSDTGAGCYQQAYDELNAMLTGQSPLSLKKAVFLVENAYFQNKMNYKIYDRSVQNLVTFCRLKMKEENIDPKDDVEVNNLLFRFMSDTLSVTEPATKRKATHYPVHYDFEDFYGKEDWTKMFVTKLMNTNFGQCHSMPLLYAILAEELGTETYLSASPSHLL